MDDKGEVLYELSPKFDFLYELTMPTGRKMKNSFIYMIVFSIIEIVNILMKNVIESNTNFEYIYKVVNIFILVLLIFSILMFIARIVFQVLTYKGIKYTFYKDCMVYENNFLNQTKKTIEYSNIRELEIKRTLLDRIFNYGVIIIYTNAEKSYGSATIIYGVKDIQKHYDNIENIIHNGSAISNPIRTDNIYKDYKSQIDLNNAMTKNEVYNDINAKSDVNPVNEKEDNDD